MAENAGTRELVERLNRLWHVAGAPPAGATLPGAFLYRLRLMLARLLAPQETFNAAVVQYVNATANALDESRIAIDEAIRYRESLAARERRIETASKTMIEAHREIRASIGQLQEATHAIKREVARLASAGASAAPAGGAGASAAATTLYQSPLDGYQYVGFEDMFRGSPDSVRERLLDYVPIFSGARDVLDVGCGRGEFLLLLREHGIAARGVDVNPAMAQACRERGLDASDGDALAYLASLPDQSLGGLFAAQVIEHFEPAYLLRFIDAAFEKLAPGAPLVLETINPACWFAFFSSYIRDITHTQPVHAETLKYLLVASGFQRVDVRYRSPYPEQHKLQRIDARLVDATPALAEWAAVANENADKLNRLLFTHLDYAAVGHRP
ncbi:MAG: class I SAM-dependent methyltransferase [Vicinamibacterales bacterium]